MVKSLKATDERKEWIVYECECGCGRTFEDNEIAERLEKLHLEVKEKVRRLQDELWREEERILSGIEDPKELDRRVKEKREEDHKRESKGFGRLKEYTWKIFLRTELE